MKMLNLNFLNDLNDLNVLIASIAICEIFAFRLIEKQIRDVELNFLLKMSNLNFSNDLIDVKFD